MVLNCSSIYYLFSFVVVSLLPTSRLITGQILKGIRSVSLALERHFAATNQWGVLAKLRGVLTHICNVCVLCTVNCVAVCSPRN
jgi:hypothetical protein